jgi:AcrR family transcriptional regulator
MQTQADRTRQRIVDAAADLFYRQGIATTSVDAVVEHAGLSKPTLYRYFDSKERLVEAYLGERARTSRESFETALARSAEPADRLLTVFDWLDEWFHEPSFRGCPFARTAAELERPGAPVVDAIHARKRWVRERLHALAVDAGIPVPVQFSDALMLLVEGATTTAFVEGDLQAARKAKRVARALVGMFLESAK